MKKFAGFKSVYQIRAQCQAEGVPIDTTFYDDGADHIAVGSEGNGIVFYNAFNGRFFGTTPEGVHFSSDEALDGTPWFDALLAFFFYGPKAGAA
jgi:hypothetical protein